MQDEEVEYFHEDDCDCTACDADRPMRDRTTDERRGKCFQCAAEYVLNEAQSFVLVHGFCIGTGGEVGGKKYVHAWAEHPGGKLVFDPVFRWMIDALTFYDMGNVSGVKKYTHMDLCEMLGEHGHWGPWDASFSANEKWFRKP